MDLDHLKRCITAETRSSVPSETGILRAAVVLLFRTSTDGTLDLLMIRRSDHPGDPWSGHMAFPGGRIEPGDDSDLDGALREVREELSLTLSPGDLLGELEPMRVPPRVLSAPMWVRAFVFHAEDLPEPSPNSEVQAVHWFSFSRFLSRESRGEFPYKHHGYDVMLPEVELNGCHIWGMSLRLIDDLMERIECPWRGPAGD
jgi:8-oxo-dGTP pyrophosphatase MutT (NUDIX family)